MKKVITSIISLVTMTSLLVGAPKKDIVDTAVDAGSFKTLVTAVKAAGLVDTLKGEGPFTVFAPTDTLKGEGPFTVFARSLCKIVKVYP